MRGNANILTQETDDEMRAEMVCDLHADTIAAYEVMGDAEIEEAERFLFGGTAVERYEEVAHAAA